LKRFILCLALGAGVLSACSASQTAQTNAGLSGTYDLTSVGNYVFVTSADRNELRALALTDSPRDWVRAPNPIEPLSIPVLERPIYLARDIHYDTDGNEVTGPYVYARSTGTDELSVVAADPAYFKEVKRLSGLGFVTAFAGRGAEDGANSVLYYATQDETGAHLFRMELPGPEALMGSGGPQQVREITPATPLTDQTVTALLVLPSSDSVQEPLVVATRRTFTSAAQGGRTFKMDAGQGTVLVDYQFGGPVRVLATNPAVASTNLPEGTCETDTTTPPKPSLSAGTYVFGVLDESVCTQQDQEACSGILAVEADTGALATDSTGNPMLPIRVGAALPTGLALAANSHVLIRCDGASTVQTRPLIGIVPASDGRISIFDAAKLRSFDLNTPTTADPNAGGAGQTGNVVVDINGTAKTTSRTPDQYINLTVQEGATRDDTYRVLYEGALQGLSLRPLRTEGEEQTAQCSDAGCTFFVEAEAVQSAMVRSGDIISLTNANGACVDPKDGTTPVDLQVTNVTVGTRPNSTEQAGLLTTGPLPTDRCSDPTRFTVRAGSQYPLVVYSDANGYLGRVMEADVRFPIPGGFYFHPQGFDPTQNTEFKTVGAFLNLANLGDLSLARGDQLIVTAQSGLLPFTAAVDTSTTAGGLTLFRLPGPVVHARVNDVDFAYIAYPSADGILQVSLAGLVDNVANLSGLVPFE
jgi:hypothetical protein